MIVTERVSKLRLEVAQGKLFLRRGVFLSTLSDGAYSQLRSHVLAPFNGVAGFIVGLPLTLAAQNINYLLSQYRGRTMAEIELRTAPGKEVAVRIAFKAGGKVS